MFSSTGFRNIASMSMVMGGISYGVGLIPLSITLSRTHLSILSIVSTGLLVGTALGVIIPEGVEEIVTSDPHQNTFTVRVAYSILTGFAFMFLVEGCVISHPAPLPSRLVTHDSHEAFAIDLDDLQPEDSEEGVFRDRSSVTSDVVRAPPRSHDVRSAYPLSLGLVVHALVDGYALGVSATDEHSSTLSLIVFFAIIVHKAPTALALTISLLSRSLPLAECKRHLVVFSLATPASAILTYLLYSLPFVSQRLGAGVPLLFSGGTFLYVATALQNTSERDCSPAAGEISKVFRTILFVAGMFFPLLVSQSLGHGH